MVLRSGLLKCVHTHLILIVLGMVVGVTVYALTWSHVHADSGIPVTVVFFTGHCKTPGAPATACTAGQQANNLMGANGTKKLPPGSKLITPQLVEGSFESNSRGTSELNKLINDTKSTKIIFIAYSGGYKALLQTVKAMKSTNPNQLKQVESIVALAADYPSFDKAASIVSSVNPKVQVVKLSEKQLGNTPHGLLASAPGTAEVASALVTAAQNGTQADIPTQFAAAPYSNSVQSAFNTVGQQQPWYQPTSQVSPSTQSVSSNPFSSAYSVPSVPQPNTSAIYAPAIQQASVTGQQQVSFIPASAANPPSLGISTTQLMPTQTELSVERNERNNASSPAVTKPTTPPATNKNPRVMTAETFESASPTPPPKTITIEAPTESSVRLTDSLLRVLSNMANILERMKNLF